MPKRQTRIPDEEQQLLNGILEYCKLKHVLAHHTSAVRTQSGYRTPIQGDVGFFDLVIAGLGGVIFAELKRRRGAKHTDEQKNWASTVSQAQTTGLFVVLWTFDDFPPLGGGQVRELIDFVARRPLAHKLGHPDPPTEGQELVASAAALPARPTVAPPTPPVASGAGATVVVHINDDAPGMRMAAGVRDELMRLRRLREPGTR